MNERTNGLKGGELEPNNEMQNDKDEGLRGHQKKYHLKIDRIRRRRWWRKGLNKKRAWMRLWPHCGEIKTGQVGLCRLKVG